MTDPHQEGLIDYPRSLGGACFGTPAEVAAWARDHG